jgi:hypothetical protein
MIHCAILPSQNQLLHNVLKYGYQQLDATIGHLVHPGLAMDVSREPKSAIPNWNYRAARLSQRGNAPMVKANRQISNETNL